MTYKESITVATNTEIRHVRQTGGKGQFAHVIASVEPAEKGAGFVFEDKVIGGRIPREYIPAVEQGAKSAMEKGVIAGYPLVDVKFTLKDGSFHEVDSSDMAFRIAGSMALQDAARRAAPILLEPVMDVEVVLPEEYLGDVIGHLNSRRASIHGIGQRGEVRLVNAAVPLIEMFGYATSLRSLSQGRATFTMQFDNYEPVPRDVADELVAGTGRRAVRAGS